MHMYRGGIQHIILEIITTVVDDKGVPNGGLSDYRLETSNLPASLKWPCKAHRTVRHRQHDTVHLVGELDTCFISDEQEQHYNDIMQYQNELS